MEAPKHDYKDYVGGYERRSKDDRIWGLGFKVCIPPRLICKPTTDPTKTTVLAGGHIHVSWNAFSEFLGFDSVG